MVPFLLYLLFYFYFVVAVVLVPATCGFCITQPDVAALEVIAGNGKSEPDIEPFGKDLQIPCYLADLTKLPEEEVGEEFTINYGPGLSVNGVSWTDEFTYTKNFTMGTVQQFYLTNNGGHPHHQRKCFFLFSTQLLCHH